MKNHFGANSLILFSAIGLILFMFIASMTQFKDGVFASLYPKKSSYASTVNPRNLPNYCNSCAADFDSDGEVTQNDLNATLSCEGKSAFGSSCINYDLDKNAQIDQKDIRCVNLVLNTACNSK